jgi:hypothetical protein
MFALVLGCGGASKPVTSAAEPSSAPDAAAAPASDAGTPMAAVGGEGGATPSVSGGAGAAGVNAGVPAAGGGAGGGHGVDAGGGGSSGSGSGAAGMTADAAGNGAALGSDCDVDPLADEKPFGSGFYQQFTGLFGCTAPADLVLFRKMLPEKFEMPADPQVCFYTIDFKISSVGPYHEAALLIPVTYKGESGKYVLSMDLDNYAATAGGRALGFPKYMGEVSITQTGHDWVAKASANGKTDLEVNYTGECHKSDEFLWPDFINLTPIPSSTTSSEAFLPPRTGSVLRVPAEYLTPAQFYSLAGSVKVSIRADLPWHGLFDESKPFPGLLSSFVGGVDLGNQPLD